MKARGNYIYKYGVPKKSSAMLFFVKTLLGYAYYKRYWYTHMSSPCTVLGPILFFCFLNSYPVVRFYEIHRQYIICYKQVWPHRHISFWCFLFSKCRPSLVWCVYQWGQSASKANKSSWGCCKNVRFDAESTCTPLPEHAWQNPFRNLSVLRSIKF